MEPLAELGTGRGLRHVIDTGVVRAYRQNMAQRKSEVERIYRQVVAPDQHLDRFVRARREDGLSWRRIAEELLTVSDGLIYVSHEWLRKTYPDPEE